MFLNNSWLKIPFTRKDICDKIKISKTVWGISNSQEQYQAKIEQYLYFTLKTLVIIMDSVRNYTIYNTKGGKTMKNKMTAVLLALLLVVSAFPCGIIAAEDVATSEVQYANEISFLQKIGVLDGTFDPSMKVTKAQFTEMVLKVLQPNGDFSVAGSNEQIFVDVGPDHTYYAYIKACKELNIVTGDNYNFFHPDSELTIIDTITILTNALGYTPYARAYGGYPTGYYTVASETGMTKGVSLSNHGAINGDVVAKLVYNALFADLVVISAIVAPEVQVEIDRNSNLLLNRLNIREYDAQLVDNGITSLIAEPSGDTERVVLNLYKEGTTVTVYKGETDIAQYIGSRMKVYVRNNSETGRDEIVHYYLHSSAKEVELDASKIISVTDTYLEYEEQKDSGKYQKFSYSAPTLIFNGVHMSSYSLELLNFTDGMIRMISLDGDNQYEVLNVISFNYDADKGINLSARNIYVDSYGDMINCRFNPAASIDVTEDNAMYQFILSPNYTEIADLSTDVVVSVAQAPEKIDGKNFYYLAVSEESVVGNVDSISHSDNAVFLGETPYELSTSILGLKPAYLDMIPMGAEVTLYLDVTGKVAYVETTASSKNYAYLIGAELDDGLTDEIRAKIFVPDVGVGVYPLRSKVTIDGQVCDTPQEQMAALQRRPYAQYEETVATGQPPIYGYSAQEYLSKPIILKLNGDGYVTEIETEYPNYPEDTTTTGKVLSIYRSMTPINYSEDEIADVNTLKAAIRTPRTASYSSKTNSVDGKYFITGSTKIISVPDIDTFGIKEYSTLGGGSHDYKLNLIRAYEAEMKDENYTTMSSGQFSADGRYDLQAYDIDPATGVPGLIVVRGRNDLLATFNWETVNPMYAVTKIVDAYDEASDTLVKKIYYTMDGVTEESAVMNLDELPFYYKYLVEGHTNETPYTEVIAPLKKGDIIRVGKTNGRLSHIERVANLNELHKNVPSSWYPSGMTYPYTLAGGRTSKTFPFYLSAYESSIDSTYVIGVGMVKEKIGSTLVVYTPKTNTGDIDPMNPATYIETYIKAGTIPLLTVTTNKTTGEVTVKKGSADDIKTAASEGKEGASQILYFHRLLTYSQMIIFNVE